VSSFRTGVGYDSHRFASGGPLILGGIRIDSDFHLEAHSDGDAIAHALTDAVLGAAGLGDIGQLFPDDSPVNAGRSSLEMLSLAVERVRAAGWNVENVDVVVVSERIRISSHREAMRAAIADSLGIEREAVGLKGKSNEGMGWIGRGEGLGCFAVASLSRSAA
jgi:2-C-methyl-D-erythritol 2,4-cyclodiphosphate synthase